jgi:terminase small subunit / prophage DNA-packing protein
LGALGQSTRPQSELDVERARLAREQADGHALKNAALRGELLPADEVVAGWQASIGRARALLLGIPPASSATIVLLARQGGDAAAAERAVREHLIRSIDSALAELSDTRDLDAAEDEDGG